MFLSFSNPALGVRQRNRAQGGSPTDTSAGTATVGDTPGIPPEEQETVYMSVRNADVGLVIGKGGSTIKRLRHRSGCEIHISKLAKTDDHEPLRRVSITGPASLACFARNSIYALLNNGKTDDDRALYGGVDDGGGGGTAPLSPPPPEQRTTLPIPAAPMASLPLRSGWIGRAYAERFKNSEHNKGSVLHRLLRENKLEMMEQTLHDMAIEDPPGVQPLVNNPDGRGVTPLMLAASKEQDAGHEVCKLLFKHGAKAGVLDRGQNTALHFAAGSGSPKTVRLLGKRLSRPPDTPGEHRRENRLPHRFGEG